MSEADDVQRWGDDVAGVALVSAALCTALVGAAPVLYLDVDPRVTGAGALVVTTLGPGGLAVVAAAQVLVAGLTLGHAWRRGVSPRWGVVALVALGLVFTAGHLRGLTDAYHGASWIGGAALGLAAAHVGALPRARRWVVAGLVALFVPYLLDAVWYRAVEHPQVVADFRARLDAVFAERGITAGSAAAATFERRLMGADVTGPIGFSNVFGSLNAAVATLACGLAADRWRALRGEKDRVTATLIPAFAGLAAAAVVVLTQSKGAMAALGLGVAIVGVWAWRGGRGSRGVRPAGRVGVGVVGVLLVLGVTGLVAVRGAVGPVSAERAAGGELGERSVLFRWQYLVSARRQLAGDGPGALWGVGPSGYGERYPATKVAASPEDVSSAHHAFADWGVALGVGGWAWALGALGLVGWAWWDGARCGGEGTRAEAREPGVLGNPRWYALGGAVALGVPMGLQLAMEAPKLGAAGRLLWMGGWLGGATVAGWVAWTLTRRPGGGGVRVAAWAAAVVVLAQAQIEMTFFQPGGVALAWVVLGLGGAWWVGAGAAGGLKPARRWGAVGVSGLGVAGALGLGLWVARPMLAQERDWREAAGQLARLGEAERPGLGVTRREAQLVANDAAGRAEAALDRAIRRWPDDAAGWRFWLALQRERVRGAARAPGLADARGLHEAAGRRLMGESGLRPTTRWRWYAVQAELAAGLWGEAGAGEEAWGEAAVARGVVVQLSPHNPDDWRALGEALVEAGRPGEAAAAYRRALAADAARYLDPGVQWPDRERARVEGLADALEREHDAG